MWRLYTVLESQSTVHPFISGDLPQYYLLNPCYIMVSKLSYIIYHYLRINITWEALLELCHTFLIEGSWQAIKQENSIYCHINLVISSQVGWQLQKSKVRSYLTMQSRYQFSLQNILVCGLRVGIYTNIPTVPSIFSAPDEDSSWRVQFCGLALPMGPKNKTKCNKGVLKSN